MIETIFPFGLTETMALVILVIGAFTMFSLMMIPSLLSGGKPLLVGQAVHCYLMKTFGLILVGVSLFPLILHLFAGTILPIEAHYGPILIFVVGLWIVLYFNQVTQSLDPIAAAVSKTVFLFGFQMIGFVLLTFGGLSIGLSFLQLRSVPAWEVPASILLIGVFVVLMFSKAAILELRSRHGFMTIVKPKRKK